MKNTGGPNQADAPSVPPMSPTTRACVERLDRVYREKMLKIIHSRLSKTILSEESPEDLWQNVIVSLAIHPFELKSPSAEWNYLKTTVSHHIANEIARARAEKRGRDWKKSDLVDGVDSVARGIQQDERVPNKKERRRSGPAVNASEEPDTRCALSSVRKRMHHSRKTPLEALVEEEDYIDLHERLPQTRMRKVARLLGRGMAIEEIAAQLGLTIENVKAEKAKIQSALKSRAPRERNPTGPKTSEEDA